MKGQLLTFLGRALLSLRYRVRIEGLETVLGKGQRGVLLLPNHPAYVDPIILVTQLFPGLHPHTLADQNNVAKPWVRWLVARVGVKPIPDPAVQGEASRAEVARVIQETIEGLRRGENYLLYPAGRIYLSRFEDLGGNSAVETILAQAPDIRVVLVRTTGLWGSGFSKAADRHPDWGKGLLRGLGALLKNGLFFSPRREVRLSLSEPGDLPRVGGRAVLNRYLEAFYNQDAPPARYVPYTFWERGGQRELPEPAQQKIEGSLEQVPASIREQLCQKLAELAQGTAFPDSALLARDLGMDSLARMELQLWIEHEFGHEVPDPEALRTVGDCLLAACGQGSGTPQAALEPPPASWFRARVPLELPKGDTLTQVFLSQAARNPGRVALADLQGGPKSYRDLITAILALKPQVQAVPGERVGIMLPASGAALVAYFTVLFSGKVPVMVNWTTGSRNLIHGLTLLKVERVLTSAQFVAKVEAMGSDLSGIRDRFWMLEDLGKALTRAEKLKAFLRARLSWRSLRQAQVPGTAAILFTSGSESLPKAVPLSHLNLLSNVRDLAAAVPLLPTDRMLGFLPPFHSFGLTGTVLLPICLGLPVVYFPNPTDGGALARMLEAYGITMLVGTPTFLSGIVRSAADAQLATLRMAVTGAEKCPEALYDLLGRRWPHLRVMEGYGITECSPVVSVNPFENPQRGTIGKPLASLEHALVDLETGLPAQAGQAGMLLVRGPSIFAGYLEYQGESPFVEFAGKTWYRTGDLVRETADGSLVFTGRLQRFVKLGGEMVSLPAVEEALLQHFSREEDQEVPLAVEATPSDTQPELVLFCTRAITREDANAVLSGIGLSPLHFIRQVRQIPQIPVLGSGKTDYRALKTLLV